VSDMTLEELGALAARIRSEVGKAVVGQDDVLDHLLVALLARGHVLLEGPPGTAKTFLAQCFAATLGLDFGRIQFTPDLMPGDILGSNLFNFQTSQFTLTRGPIFCDLLLADEINRTPPKTQAALLEAMQERRVTLDGHAHPLPPHFMVVATQNPIESQGSTRCPKRSSTGSCSSCWSLTQRHRGGSAHRRPLRRAQRVPTAGEIGIRAPWRHRRRSMLRRRRSAA
jgi:MoxR-like ATPase